MEARRLLIMLVCMVAMYVVSFAEPQVYTISGAGIAPAAVPSGATEIKGDVKIDTMYFSSDGTPISNRSELIGPLGPKGDRGNTILNGTGAPPAGLGNSGDFYMDTQNRTLYGPKDSVNGWGSGFTLVQLDPNLNSGNIKTGVTLFGVPGSVIQATGDAAAGDVLITKTFSNATAAGIPGTMPNNLPSTITPGTADQTIAAGYHSGAGKVAGDVNLISSNIITGVTIFGVSGTRHRQWGCSTNGAWDPQLCKSDCMQVVSDPGSCDLLSASTICGIIGGLIFKPGINWCAW